MGTTARDLVVRTATADDLQQIVDIYNHYVLHTAITFDIDAVTIENRRAWFAQFAPTGRHRLFVVEQQGTMLGYAGTHQFRTKAAYDTTVETTVYCAPSAVGQGVGTLLYGTLFEAIREEDIHSLLAGITLPNAPSVALHRRFGFTEAGVTHAVGRKFDRYWDVGWYERVLD